MPFLLPRRRRAPYSHLPQIFVTKFYLKSKISNSRHILWYSKTNLWTLINISRGVVFMNYRCANLYKRRHFRSNFPMHVFLYSRHHAICVHVKIIYYFPHQYSSVIKAVLVGSTSHCLFSNGPLDPPIHKIRLLTQVESFNFIFNTNRSLLGYT